jgi:hypothetical protein
MYTTILIVFGVIVLLVLLLTRISPFESDFTSDLLVINDEKQENVKYVEVEKIVEKPVEIIKEIEVIKEVPVEVIKEDKTQIKNLQKEIKKLVKQNNNQNTVWRNIGLELYSNNDHNKFLSLLNEILGKNVIICSSSTFVLGSNYKGYKTYDGVFSKYEVLDNREPYSPLVRLFVTLNSGYQLNWIFDATKFNKEFSSSKSVSIYLNNKQIDNELFLSSM